MTLAIARKHKPMALCSKEKARFGTWRFILPPSPIKSPILRCLPTNERKLELMHGVVKGVLHGVVKGVLGVDRR
jgi:hypothetical protein